jgi:hypothetical protein
MELRHAYRPRASIGNVIFMSDENTHTIALSARALHGLDTLYSHRLPLKVGAVHKFIAGLRGVQFGRGVQIYGRPTISICPGSNVEIGDEVVLVSSSRRCSTANLYGPFRLTTSFATATIQIGPRGGFNGTSLWCRSTSITIGSDAAFGPNVVIMDSPAHPIWPPDSRNHYPGTELDRPVTIGDRVWIGNGALIMPGVTIGDNSVVGARSVVTKDVSPNTLVAGVPAKVIRHLG